RISTDRHDDGNRAGRVLERPDPRLPQAGHEDVHPKTDQLGGEERELFLSALLSNAPLDDDVLPLHPAELTQPVLEGRVEWFGPGTIPHQKANPRHLARLLRLG